MTLSITEYEEDTIAGEYITLVEAGANTTGDKMIVRNTLVAQRIQVRIDEDNDNVFTVSPGEKMTIGGFSELRGKKIEVKDVTDVANSFKLNLLS